MKKILFLHGLNWSGECPPALTLRKELEDVAEITAPDLPVNPEDALKCFSIYAIHYSRI